MRIDGAKNLNKNDYKNIVINYNQIKVQSDRKTPTIKNMNPFTRSLKGLTNEEVIDKVISYFLDYTKINELNDRAYHYGKHYIEISGVNRKLRLRVKPSDILKNNIINKYINDRYSSFTSHIVEEEQIYTINSSSTITSYKTDENDIIEVTLLNKNEKLPIFEKEFLHWFIESISKGKYIRLKQIYTTHKDYDGYLYEILDGTYLMIDGKKKIRINSPVSPVGREIKKIMNEHNAELSENLSLQLKMKGV